MQSPHVKVPTGAKQHAMRLAMGSSMRGLEVRRIERFPWGHRILQSTQEPNKTKE